MNFQAKDNIKIIKPEQTKIYELKINLKNKPQKILSLKSPRLTNKRVISLAEKLCNTKVLEKTNEININWKKLIEDLKHAKVNKRVTKVGEIDLIEGMESQLNTIITGAQPNST